MTSEPYKDNEEGKWFKRLINETTLLDKSKIIAKDRYVVELYLSGTSVEKIIIETKLNKKAIDAILLKSLVKMTRRINELENKERHLDQMLKYLSGMSEIENQDRQAQAHDKTHSKAALIENIQLSVRARGALKRMNIIEVNELTKLTIAKLLLVPNLGRRTITEIIDCADEYGITIN